MPTEVQYDMLTGMPLPGSGIDEPDSNGSPPPYTSSSEAVRDMLAGGSESSSEAVRDKLYGNSVDVPGVQPDANPMDTFWKSAKQVVDTVSAVPGRAVNAGGRMIRNVVVGVGDTAGQAGGKVLQPFVDQIKSLISSLTWPLAILAVIAVAGLVVFLAMRPKVSVG